MPPPRAWLRVTRLNALLLLLLLLCLKELRLPCDKDTVFDLHTLVEAMYVYRVILMYAALLLRSNKVTRKLGNALTTYSNGDMKMSA